MSSRPPLHRPLAILVAVLRLCSGRLRDGRGLLTGGSGLSRPLRTLLLHNFLHLYQGIRRSFMIYSIGSILDHFVIHDN